MNILWLIIKIVLWIVLGLLVIVLAGLGVILSSPVRYEAYLSKEEQLTYEIKWRYLFGVKGLFYQDFHQKNHSIKVFGKTLYKEDIQFKETNTYDAVKTHEAAENVQKTKESKQTLHASGYTSVKKAEKPSPITVKKIEKVSPVLKEETQKEAKQVEEDIKEKAKETANHLSWHPVKALLLDKRMYGAIKEIVFCIWRIFKELAPDEWDFEVVVGKENPADTGELIAKLTMLYPIYNSHGIIRGNYEKECLEGGFLIKGKFTFGKIVWQILRCILSEPVWWLIKKIVNLRKEDENGK